MRDLPAGLPSRADTPVTCDRCGVTALVGKTSWQQTSIQWPDNGTATCLELGGDQPAESAPGFTSGFTSGFADAVRSCAALRRAIDKAALADTLPVADQT